MENQTVTFKEKVYTLDSHGFLDPADQWDEHFAEGMAGKLGIHGGMTEEHWAFILYLRKKFLEENTVPVIVLACADNGLRLNQLRGLFPSGYHRGACKIAGINFAFMCDTNIWLTYECIPAVEAEHRVDELGFLQDFDTWNDRFVHRVVQSWNLPEGLTETHWKIIQYLRNYYGKTKNIPSLYEVCKIHDISLDDFGRLFPAGYRRGACRAAGLPFPV